MSFNYQGIQAKQVYIQGKTVVRMYINGVMVYPTTAFRIDVDGYLLSQDEDFLQSTVPFYGFLTTQQNDYLCIDNINAIEYTDYWYRQLSQDVDLVTQLNDKIILEYEQ
jgi:hypothetical protein